MAVRTAARPRSQSLISGTALRAWHANTSAFIAPMVLFFSLSGVLQIFDLHETHGPYTAPAVLTAIGRLHKNQVFAAVPPRARPAGGPATAGGRPPASELPTVSTYVLKWIFALEGLALAATTVFGIWIGLTHAKRKRTMLGLLAAGTVVPLIFVVLH